MECGERSALIILVDSDDHEMCLLSCLECKIGEASNTDIDRLFEDHEDNSLSRTALLG